MFCGLLPDPKVSDGTDGKPSQPYVGRAKEFKTRFRTHIRKKIGQLENIIGRVKFFKMGKLTGKELNLIEELLIRAVEDLTDGTNLSSINNARYNYGSDKKNRKSSEDSETFETMLKKIKRKCKAGKW
jgi:hypothetical protein